MSDLYFREQELKRLDDFAGSKKKKALAIYGRRRTGKTELVLHFMKKRKQADVLYFQCTGYDYNKNLGDFRAVLKTHLPDDTILDSLQTFKDCISYFAKSSGGGEVIVIDEFPFLCKKNEDVAVEFQWIIDHGLFGLKIILLGSNLSFMKKQMNDTEAPLYGRFDEMIEVVPFTFPEVNHLFPVFEDAVNVYAQTGGVAQYVMMYKDYRKVRTATAHLFFQKSGRLLQEAENILMQELRDTTTYVSVLRVLSGGDKDSGQIAARSGIDPRSVFSYLNKLIDLGIVDVVPNLLTSKKNEKRYRIRDALFRFNYFFIEPHISMITAMGENSMKVILDDRYTQYLGYVYEDIIRENIYAYAMNKRIPFVPTTVGKWWGNIMHEGVWGESEVDLVAYDDHNVVIGECKYRNKKVGRKELETLREKASFIPAKGRKYYYLLASKAGFTDDVKREDAILIEGA